MPAQIVYWPLPFARALPASRSRRADHLRVVERDFLGLRAEAAVDLDLAVLRSRAHVDQVIQPAIAACRERLAVVCPGRARAIARRCPGPA